MLAECHRPAYGHTALWLPACPKGQSALHLGPMGNTRAPVPFSAYTGALMEELLHASAQLLSRLFEAATLVLLALGALMAVRNLVAGALARRPANEVALEVWQGLSRWTMVGLEFLLASDLVSTVVSPSWDELGRLATVAAIRTLLGFFLGRDLEAARKIAAKTRRWPPRPARSGLDETFPITLPSFAAWCVGERRPRSARGRPGRPGRQREVPGRHRHALHAVLHHARASQTAGPLRPGHEQARRQHSAHAGIQVGPHRHRRPARRWPHRSRAHGQVDGAGGRVATHRGPHLLPRRAQGCARAVRSGATPARSGRWFRRIR